MVLLVLDPYTHKQYNGSERIIVCPPCRIGGDQLYILCWGCSLLGREVLLVCVRCCVLASLAGVCSQSDGDHAVHTRVGEAGP